MKQKDTTRKGRQGQSYFEGGGIICNFSLCVCTALCTHTHKIASLTILLLFWLLVVLKIMGKAYIHIILSCTPPCQHRPNRRIQATKRTAERQFLMHLIRMRRKKSTALELHFDASTLHPFSNANRLVMMCTCVDSIPVLMLFTPWCR